MRRRTFLSLAAVAAASASWSRYIEPTFFELSHTRVRAGNARPRRILHISDMHISDGLNAAELEVGFRAGFAQKPDLILLTGDFVSSTSGFDRKGLVNLLHSAVATAPTYAVLGNHDQGNGLALGGHQSTAFMQDLIPSTGVRLLHNESAAFEDLTLVGVADFWSSEFAPDRAFANAPPSPGTILLCHNPDGKRAVAHLPWHLMLSGHTHGGQVRVPGFDPIWVPVEDKQFIAGLYEWQDRQIYITRGLGSPKHVRAFCRPEISVLHIG